jgi:hypothetical protein
MSSCSTVHRISYLNFDVQKSVRRISHQQLCLEASDYKMLASYSSFC